MIIFFYAFFYAYIHVINKLAKQPPSAAFPLFSGDAAFGGGKKCKKKFEVTLKKYIRKMVLELPQGHEGSELPNVCLVLKLNNGKVVSIAHDRQYRKKI